MVEITKRALVAHAREKRDEFESLLKEIVEIPTVSAQPVHLPDIARGVEWAAETIRKFGGEVEVIKTAGNPIVHGRFDLSKKAPTVTVYNHMDVQPASRETEPWTSEPFVFTREGDKYLGRGTTDDKGPALAALFGLRAAREAGVPINMNILWEFEEEIGSPNFEKGIAGAKKRLATDSVLVSDTIWVTRGYPACPAGLRGMAAFILRLETATTDTHSGTTGGAVRNPLGELMKLVAEMYDATTGKVKIKGFYDDVVMPTKKEIADFVGSGFTVKRFMKDHKLKSIRSTDAVDVMKRLWALPTMEVHGVTGGYTGPGVKTIVPPSAEVKVSCRLVQNQKPATILKLIRQFIRERNPDIEFIPENQMMPYKAPTEGPLPDAVRSAMKFGFGKEPVFIREGGSIGAVASMEQVLECPVLFLGLSLPEHGYHAPNENFDWGQTEGGIVSFAKYFDEIARL